MDTAPVLLRLWEQFGQPAPSEKEERKDEFIRISAEAFLPAYQDDEAAQEDFRRHAYTLFLPLAGQCVLGDAAEILETEDPERLYALTLRTEERVDDFRQLAWARALALASIRVCDWKDTEHVERSRALARTFAGLERLFLPACYSSRALEEEGIFVLPPLHRFGWYCAQAYEALDGGDQAEYVRLLRLALESCPDVKPMVQFLLDRLEEERHQKAIAAAPPELLALAEQVRGVLKQYPPDDPAVEELRQSPVYRKVAYLIEEPAAPGAEGIRQ